MASQLSGNEQDPSQGIQAVGFDFDNSKVLVDGSGPSMDDVINEGPFVSSGIVEAISPRVVDDTQEKHHLDGFKQKGLVQTEEDPHLGGYLRRHRKEAIIMGTALGVAVVGGTARVVYAKLKK